MTLHRLLSAFLGLALSLSILGTSASAEPTPTPSPSPTPTPTPTGSPSSSATPMSSASGAPSASPSAGASATRPPGTSPTSGGSPSPSATPTASFTAEPTPSPDPEAAQREAEAARKRDAELLASAKSLSQVIDAQARVATDELVALDSQLVKANEDLAAINEEIASLHAKANFRATVRDRLERDALRLAELPPAYVPRNLSDAQREAYEDLRALQTGLIQAQGRLSERAETLARLKQSVGAKQAQLARLRDRGRVLAAAAAAGDLEAKEAQVAVLKSLAYDATAAQSALAQLVASALVREPGDTGTWSLPLRGVITQTFGPSALPYSPSRSFGGVLYPHFHDAIDIAAPLGTPVVAAAGGQVTFVGHLPDGAMIVLVAHAGGYVSEYAHLDDTFALPPVRAGQQVTAGEVIGYVGLTGMTTGPHVHFAVMRDGQPIDPLTLLSAR